MTRHQALTQILTFGPEVDEAYGVLASFGFTQKDVPFVVTKATLYHVLQKYLAGSIDADDLEEWANFVECREDVHYEEVEGYVYSLANPALMGDISDCKIMIMLQLLSAT